MPCHLRRAPSVKSDRLIPELRSAQGDHKDRTEADHRESGSQGQARPRELSVKVMGAIIEARDLVKRFDDFTAVDHISFAVAEGVIFGFLGPNGAGKTTTIKMLTTVLKPTEGRLLIAGHDPVKEPLLVRRAFGIVFQDPSLDGELTAAENMELHGVLYRVPREERRERVESLLRFVGLWERQDDYVKRLSGGMRRRLEIARAVQHRPRILFLDEPTAGLALSN